jgi:hypothetical protein
VDHGFLSDIARAVDRSRRLSISCRVQQQIAEVPRGWMCWEPGVDSGPYPSGSPNRVHWFSAEEPLTRGDLLATIDAIRARSLPRMYFMINPRGWTAAVDRELNSLGATLFPHAGYPVLVRRAGAAAPGRPAEFSVRIVPAREAPPVLAAAEGWYSTVGTARAQRMLDKGIGELHAAFEGERPVALTFLMMLGGGFSYLGSAGTDPAKRGRGAQSALICSRVSRAAELGAEWCISETNTAVPISLGNLKRCGFEAVFDWRVYRWEDPQAPSRQ